MKPVANVRVLPAAREPRTWATFAALGALVAVGCAAPAVTGAASATTPPPSAAASASNAAPSAPPTDAPALPAAATPDVELREGTTALVGSAGVAFDGIDEGLAWPALARAVTKKGTVVITATREVPLRSVLRAVWTLRAADVHVQTPDAGGAVRVVDFGPKPAQPAPGCHLAVFLAGDGALRVAAPGGPRLLSGADAAVDLARALEAERATCALRYIAFGAEDAKATWGSVFDVAWAVTRAKSQGDARVVLAEPLHATR